MKEKTFDQIMSIKGEVYRKVKNRETLRFIENGKAYFIKKHFGISFKELWKNLLQLRLPVISAKHEWQAIQKLEQLKISTMKLVKFGERGINPFTKQSFIITEEIPKTIGLRDVCLAWQQKPLSFKVKQKLIKEIAHIAKTLHQNGVNHRDFYIAHFLWDKNKLYVIDLHRTQIRNKIPTRWIIKDLAALYFSAQAILTTRDVFRFLQYYFDTPWKVVIKNKAKLLKKIVARAAKMHEENKIIKNIKKFIKCRNEYYTTQMQQILQNPDKFITPKTLLSAGDTCTVAKIKVNARELVIKRYNTKDKWHAINRALRQSRAARCWNNAEMLLAYKINTPKPIAMIENRFGPLRGKAYLITEYISGKPVLDYLPTIQNPIELQNIAQQLIGIFAKLYKHHIKHGDMKANNFILTKNGKVYLIDLDGMRKYSAATYKRKQAFAKDKARFMKNWRDYPAVTQLFEGLYDKF